ncbi:MAG: hypothetical protein U0U46_07870 [Saprospiraceae bacterium]
MFTKYRLLLAAFLLPAVLWANIAQPGLYMAGGNGAFRPIYPEDSTALGRIQMAREAVFIQVYPGYAVVKGRYWMYNAGTSAVRMKTGYPLSPDRHGQDIGMLAVDFRFDTLSALRIQVNGRPTAAVELANDPEMGSWYVWDMTFAPHDTTLVEVYFIVSTNDAMVRQGYHHKESNALVYVLESGASWQHPIGEGLLCLQLMDGLDFDDVDGLWPDSVYQVDEQQRLIVRQFRDLTPAPADNLVATCGKHLNAFDFKEVVRRAAVLYAAADRLSENDPAGWQLHERRFGNPFEVSGFNFPWLAVALIGMFVLPVLLLIVVVRWWRRGR